MVNTSRNRLTFLGVSFTLLEVCLSVVDKYVYYFLNQVYSLKKYVRQ